MKNVNHWKLIALFGGLVLVFAAVRIFRSPMMEGNLPASLTDIDSSRVTELVITPGKDPRSEIRLVKAGGWKLKKGEEVFRLDEGAGTNALRMLMSLKPERMVSKKESKWNEFMVDSTGTRIKVMAGGAVETDLLIGRSGLNQSSGQQSMGTSYTFVRLAADPEVYAVNGYLDALFNRSLNDWRDKGFLRLKRDSVNRVTFQYPGDSSFVLEKKGKWMISNQLADSTAVGSYLSGMEYRNLQGFADRIPIETPLLFITYERGGKMIAKIEAWPGVGSWTARSSHQPDTYFIVDFTTFKDIFPRNRKFDLKP